MAKLTRVEAPRSALEVTWYAAEAALNAAAKAAAGQMLLSGNEESNGPACRIRRLQTAAVEFAAADAACRNALAGSKAEDEVVEELKSLALEVPLALASRVERLVSLLLAKGGH